MSVSILPRKAIHDLNVLLEHFPAVVIVGARQIGKTTLAKALVQLLSKDSIYLDLELPSDRSKLQNAELFFNYHQDRCVILDEVQRERGLFPLLRSIIDQNKKPARFILLGSASPELIRDSSETLAGRVAYYQLFPFSIDEVGVSKENELWVKGGFPDSFLAINDSVSLLWRKNFIRSYLERDLPLLGLNASPIVIRRLWEILAHQNGQLLNVNAISKSLGLSSPTVRSYIDFMESAFLIHVIKPFFPNVKKRLVKSPKTYLIDTGILHGLLDIESFDTLLGTPYIGSSFENFILNQIVTVIDLSRIYFYRTADGTEIDFVITKGGVPHISIEVKLNAAPSTTKSLTLGIQDLKTPHNYIVAPIAMGYPLTPDIMVVSVGELMEILESHA